MPAPEEAMLVGKGNQVKHATALTTVRRLGTIFIPSLIDVERDPKRMIAEYLLFRFATNIPWYKGTIKSEYQVQEICVSPSG